VVLPAPLFSVTSENVALPLLWKSLPLSLPRRSRPSLSLTPFVQTPVTK